MNKFISLFLMILLVFSNLSLTAQFEGDQVFDDTFVHEIRITCDKDISSLFTEYISQVSLGDFEYAIAEIDFDGTKLDSIGIRVKGGISAWDNKKPFKLDFNEYVLGRKLDGLKKLNLHQGNMDPSYLRETISYKLMRQVGLHTVRTSFAKVYYNNRFEGIYTLVEQVNDDFIQNHFASNKGTLYKSASRGLEVKFEEDNSLPIDEFRSIVNSIPNSILHEELHNYLNVEAFLRFMVMEIILNNVDSPLTVDHNYYLYYEPKSRTYEYIPWDYNLSLDASKHEVMMLSANFIFEKVKLNPILRERYTNTFCQVLNLHFNPNEINAQINRLRDLLAEEVLEDPYIGELGDFNQNVTQIKSIISARSNDLRSELEMLSVNCLPFLYEYNEKDIVINEIVASNNPESGILDPEGGAADWIELYNNTNHDISLNHFYLSNDNDFIKKWKFTDGLFIPANDYLIIWADRDIDQTGIHTSFKLNKTRGDLILSYETGDIIDSMSYANQVTNVAFARVPNGSGSFRMQSPTFMFSNELFSSLNEVQDDRVLSVYPNPTSDYVNLLVTGKSHASISIDIFDQLGRIHLSEERSIQKGSNTIQIDLSELSIGPYYIKVTDENHGSIGTSSIILII